ncbi:hypothetical protein [Rhizobium miluonense]|uniref:Uncharacterized protein n=1 Tax=Rhizobium miluonense TaxID=411945 RepID=A0A1C3WF22_9HYPH|nr:hypothetical protein [Rhizobium miluonense]SCB38629.1 hypothetical protein GA0061102_102864 [Rhizobium miluonense]
MTKADADGLYRVLRDSQRTWAVYNTLTGEQASIMDLQLIGLTRADAEDFMSLLNWLQARRRECGNF